MYDFFKDQGSMIAGVLALIAGIMAYVAGLKQAAATRQAAANQIRVINEQSEQLKRKEIRDRARQTLSSARIMEGVLKNVYDNLCEQKFGGSSDTDLGEYTTNQIRQNIHSIPQYDFLPYLQYLGREIIDKYFFLHNSIEDFRRKSSASTARSLSEKLETLKKVVEFLRDELEQETQRSLKILVADLS